MREVPTIAAITKPPLQRYRAGSKKLARALSVTERAIHLAVVERLQLGVMPHVFWCHIPNGEARAKVTGAILRAMGVKAGVPDLMFLIGGRRPHFLELKRETGRTSLDQQGVHREMRQAGAVVEVAYGFDDAMKILQRWGVLR